MINVSLLVYTKNLSIRLTSNMLLLITILFDSLFKIHLNQVKLEL